MSSERFGDGVRPSGSDTADTSRIEQPQPPPIDRRGGSALAFGVLRADAESPAGFSETELAVLEADSEEPPAASDDFPTRPDLVLIDGGLGQLGVAREVLESSASPMWYWSASPRGPIATPAASTSTCRVGASR